MQWTIFSSMFDNIGPPILGSVDGIVAALQGWMRPILMAGVPLFVMMKMLWKSLNGGGGSPLNEALADAVAGSIIVYFACEAAGLGPQLRNLILNGLSTEIGRVVVGSLGARPVAGSLFDDAWGRAFASGLDTYSKLPWSVAGFGLALVVVIYWLVAAVCIGVAFYIWMTSYILVALLVGLWPLGVGLFAFPWTRGIAWGWARTTAANVLLQIMVVTLMSIAIAALTRVLGQLQSTTGAGGGLSNEVRQVQVLLGAMIITMFIAWLATQLPGAAANIAHGFTGFNQMPRFRMSGSGGAGGGGSNGAGDSSRATAGGPHQQAGTGGHAGSTPAAMPQSTPPGRALGS